MKRYPGLILATAILFLVVLSALIISIPVTTASGGLVGKLICIDPGHGGNDPGAVGYVVEKEINLAVSLKLKTLLEADGAVVVMTRSGDYDVSLSQRVQIANNAGCHIFVSIHSNAATSSSARGFEAYYYYGSTQGYTLASLIYQEVLKLVPIPGRGVKEAGFYVLKYTVMPATLLELGFVTNYEDSLLLSNTTMQWRYAYGILHGIQRYFGAPVRDPLAPSIVVNNVRYARHSTYIRFVVDLSRQANYTTYYWSSPEWLAVMIYGARLNNTIKNTWNRTPSGWYYRDTGIPEVPRVYVQERSEGVLVVLATTRRMPYTTFTLTNPFRIVVDLSLSSQTSLMSIGGCGIRIDNMFKSFMIV